MVTKETIVIVVAMIGWYPGRTWLW